jgi:hypothetical protein
MKPRKRGLPCESRTNPSVVGGFAQLRSSAELSHGEMRLNIERVERFLPDSKNNQTFSIIFRATDTIS